MFCWKITLDNSFFTQDWNLDNFCSTADSKMVWILYSFIISRVYVFFYGFINLILLWFMSRYYILRYFCGISYLRCAHVLNYSISHIFNMFLAIFFLSLSFVAYIFLSGNTEATWILIFQISYLLLWDNFSDFHKLLQQIKQCKENINCMIPRWGLSTNEKSNDKCM